MIWSPGRNYLFIHIPKTGGTSMALALEARAMKDDVMLGDTPKALKRRRRVAGVQTAGRLWKHSTLADLDGLIPHTDLADLFVFTLVRNPWDRFVSYYHWLRAQRFDHPAVGYAQAHDFCRFLSEPYVQDSFRKTPAASYVTDRAGIMRCRAFIRLEHFAEDAGTLQAHLGFDLALPHTNASERRGAYIDHYTKETAEIVADICATDIAQFGYRFDDP